MDAQMLVLSVLLHLYVEEGCLGLVLSHTKGKILEELKTMKVIHFDGSAI